MSSHFISFISYTSSKAINTGTHEEEICVWIMVLTVKDYEDSEIIP